MAERTKKLPESKWILLCCGVILIAACAAGAAVWFTRPPTLEEMTAHMPENPSKAWMQRYVELSRDSMKELYLNSHYDGEEDWESWETWIDQQPLVDEVGGGQFFIAKWAWAVPSQYPGFSIDVPLWKQEDSEEYARYYVDCFPKEPVFRKIVAAKVDDPEAWWENFEKLPVYKSDEEKSEMYVDMAQFDVAKWMYSVPASMAYPYEELEIYQVHGNLLLPGSDWSGLLEDRA